MYSQYLTMPPRLKDFVRHYSIRVAIVLAAWGMKAVSRRIRTGGARRAARKAAGSTAGPAVNKQPPPAMRFMWNPARDYKANNPNWLVEAVQWTPQDIPQDLLLECPALTAFKEAVASGKMSVQFGSQECKQLFALDPSFTYLNHGSYGAAFQVGLDVQSWYRQQLELQPVRFMETTGVAGLIKAVADVAAFVSADWQDVVPVINATTAVNTVVNSVKLKKGDLLLVANTTYPAVRSTLAQAAARAGAGLLDISFELKDLLDEERIISCFKTALKVAGHRLKLVVIDHVVSFPPVMMPVKQICDMCSAAGIPVLVDGAHAVGALPDLDVPSLGCQYYTTNLHKWMCTPKGAALLWVHSSKQGDVHPLVVSHGYGLGFRGEFMWLGTADPTAWMSVSACVDVMNALQPQRVAEYNHNLVKQGAALLQKAWGTEIAVGVGKDGRTAGMVAVQLPWPLKLTNSYSDSSVVANGHTSASAAVNGVADGHVNGVADVARQPTPADAVALNKLFRQVYRIEVPVACVEGMLFCRISAQIYNNIADYQRLAGVVLELACRAEP